MSQQQNLPVAQESLALPSIESLVQPRNFQLKYADKVWARGAGYISTSDWPFKHSPTVHDTLNISFPRNDVDDYLSGVPIDSYELFVNTQNQGFPGLHQVNSINNGPKRPRGSIPSLRGSEMRCQTLIALPVVDGQQITIGTTNISSSKLELSHTQRQENVGPMTGDEGIRINMVTLDDAALVINTSGRAEIDHITSDEASFVRIRGREISVRYTSPDLDQGLKQLVVGSEIFFQDIPKGVTNFGRVVLESSAINSGANNQFVSLSFTDSTSCRIPIRFVSGKPCFAGDKSTQFEKEVHILLEALGIADLPEQTYKLLERADRIVPQTLGAQVAGVTHPEPVTQSVQKQLEEGLLAQPAETAELETITDELVDRIPSSELIKATELGPILFLIYDSMLKGITLTENTARLLKAISQSKGLEYPDLKIYLEQLEVRVKDSALSGIPIAMDTILENERLLMDTIVSWKDEIVENDVTRRDDFDVQNLVNFIGMTGVVLREIGRYNNYTLQDIVGVLGGEISKKVESQDVTAFRSRVAFAVASISSKSIDSFREFFDNPVLSYKDKVILVKIFANNPN